jgi:hypothetical protein
MRKTPCHILDLMRHTVTMRVVDSGRSVPEVEIESIALDMLVELERRLRTVDLKTKEARK